MIGRNKREHLRNKSIHEKYIYENQKKSAMHKETCIEKLFGD